MALFVYTTRECEEDIDNHAVTHDIERFRKRLLQAQRTDLFDNFPPPYMKKRFHRQLRLIARQYPFCDGEHLIVCFLRLLVRGSADYEDFLNNPREYGDRYLASLVNTADLETWLKEQLRENPPPAKAEPTDIERRYLWDVMGESQTNLAQIFVCESEDWVRAVTDKKVRNRLVLLAEAILEASEKGPSDNHIIYVRGQGDIRIVGRLFPHHSKLFLAGLLTEVDGEESRVRQRYASILEPEAGSVTEELILQNSMRAYPNELLLDVDLWIDVEQDEASNLALSPEEATILESVHSQVATNGVVGFPLFINGRAGSGKSTILQYLFADYLRLHFSMPEQPSVRPPIYFTCSADLLQRSMKVVSGLLKCGHRYVLRHHQSNNNRNFNEELLRMCFRDFHDFLYSFLSSEDRAGRFSRRLYVDHARFKGLWQLRFGRDPVAIREYGPDISWHIIRSYIKGLSVDGYLDPDEYRAQPEKEKTVSTQCFKTVYERVWESWYRPMCEEGLHWDDQDLARHLIEIDAVKAEYPAIFCDEAQDFTRLELEIIFRLSIFSQRRLTPQELNRVPFAFAGDPFQTLNPTGFRWEAIKSAFVQKFIRSLDPACRSGIRDMNYRELSFNYRSTKNIVRLCNTIQALRSFLFDISNLKPQTTWQYEQESPIPLWFEKGNDKVLEALRNEKDLTIIIPCLEGEEVDYVAKDEFLASAVQRDDTGVANNVLSATRAKGLEFNRVVLYGFGESAFEDLLMPLQRDDLWNVEPEWALPREYFINRLYVAASRPKRRLFVIDTQRGLDRLWSFATDLETQRKLLARLRHSSEVWRDSIGLIEQGRDSDWSSDRDGLKDIAERYEREGKARKDAYMLRSAAMSYSGVGDNFKARQCRASALLYERRFKEAGDEFAECGDYDQSLAAYWEGSEYAAIVELGRIAGRLHGRLEHRISDFISHAASLETAIELLRLFDERLTDLGFRNESLSSQAWCTAIGKIFEKLVQEIQPNGDIRKWVNVASYARRLADMGFAVRPRILGALFFRAQDWTGAISAWERAGETQSEDFRTAKAHLLVGDIEAGRKTDLSIEEARIVADHYTRRDQFAIALKYWKKARDEKGFARVCVAALARGDRKIALEAVEAVVELFVASGRWADMTDLSSEGRWALVQGDASKALSSLVKDNGDRILAKTALCLADSDGLVKAEASQKRRVWDYLKNCFINDIDSWCRHTTPDVAGAAIERAGRVIDALMFYENVIASSVLLVSKRTGLKSAG
ncbi:MAG: hypothetical protein NZ740_10195 [Kiritimatiellae bacterium]|nr:hypothetical protein [Kiritimatiellia bacterium]MDW8459458.1 hypothetical protein [Verrucomicrobiota bacterium]